MAANFPSGLIAMAVTGEVWKSAGTCLGSLGQFERVGQVPDADLAVVGAGDGEDALLAGRRADHDAGRDGVRQVMLNSDPVLRSREVGVADLDEAVEPRGDDQRPARVAGHRHPADALAMAP